MADSSVLSNQFSYVAPPESIRRPQTGEYRMKVAPLGEKNFTTDKARTAWMSDGPDGRPLPISSRTLGSWYNFD